MFIIKVLANKADEAEQTYKQIQNKYDEAIKEKKAESKDSSQF